MTAVGAIAFMLLVAGTVGIVTTVLWITACIACRWYVKHWPRPDVNSVVNEERFTIEDWAEISTYLRKQADQ